MRALLLDRADEALDRSILLRKVGRGELLAESVVSLKVKPRISSNGMVFMEITQHVSSPSATGRVIGALLGTQNQSNNRQEVLVLITPTVIRDPAEARRLTDEYGERFRGLEPLRKATGKPPAK